MIYREDEDVVWFNIPLDHETVARLMHLSEICHGDPRQVAASLIHDVLKDDEQAHDPNPTVPASNATRLN